MQEKVTRGEEYAPQNDEHPEGVAFDEGRLKQDFGRRCVRHVGSHACGKRFVSLTSFRVRLHLFISSPAIMATKLLFLPEIFSCRPISTCFGHFGDAV